MRAKYINIHALSFSSQRGVVLVTGLIIVLLLTIIGIAAIRGSGLQEAMAFNMRDRTVAFQSAESVLRACEILLAPAIEPALNCKAGGGVCNDLNMTPSDSVNNNEEHWLNMARNMKGQLNWSDMPAVSEQPKCLIEIIQPDVVQCNFVMGNSTQIGSPPPNCPRSYRVTAQGSGAEKTTKVVLQSTYAN